MKKILMSLIIFISVPALAEEPKGAIEIFRSQTQYQSLICTLGAKLAMTKLELGEISNIYEPIGKCLKDGNAAVKPLFQKALNKIAKKPTAVKLLKIFYGAWMASFSAISPKIDDRKIDYKNRLDDLEAKSERAWNDFEIETM